MSTKKTRISNEIDLSQPGKQNGYLKIPHPRNTSAWGVLNVPITSIKNGEGPCLLFTAGVHGDEYEGPVTLARLARDIQPQDIEGQIVILPSMNVAGLKSSTRLSPVDHKDMNRNYPGDADGTPTEMLTHFVSSELIPHADAVIDYHSGGYSLEFVPCALMHKLDNQDQFNKTMKAIEAFGAPLTLVLEEIDSGGMLDSYVEGLGKVFVTTEFSGGGNLSIEALRVAEKGTWQLLHHFAVIAESHPQLQRLKDEVAHTQFMEVPDHSYYVSAPEDGIYEPLLGLGEVVVKGQAVGVLHSVDNPTREPVVLKAVRDGILLARRAPALTESGDCLAVIARSYPST